MAGSEWNFLSFVLPGIAFSYGLLMFAFARLPVGKFLRTPKSVLARSSRIRAEEIDGVTVFSLSGAYPLWVGADPARTDGL